MVAVKTAVLAQRLKFVPANYFILANNYVLLNILVSEYLSDANMSAGNEI